jgi:hypothetical protein
MNVEAEAMIERLVWRRIVPCLVGIVLIAAAGIFWWSR